jgi:hypothetical protein
VFQRAAAVVCGVLALVWPAVATAQSAIRGLSADRYDVSLRLLPDGSMDVRETVVFRFSGKSFSKVERELSLHHSDGIIDVRAFLDGQPVPEGREEGQADIRPGRRRVRVTWRFPGTINQSRTFTLEYRAMNVVSIANGRARIEWTVLPSRHRYPIAEARVEWRVPPDAVRVDPTTLDDTRWTTGVLPDGWMAARTGVDLDETVVLRDAFQASTLASAVPAWQTHEYRAQQMAPSFVIGALTLLVIAVGVLVMMRLRYPAPALDTPVILPAGAGDLPPAIATSLSRGRVAAGMPQVQAAILDLVRRGIIQVHEESGGKQPEFLMHMSARRDLRPHEHVLADALWLHMKQGTLALKAARGPLSKAVPAFGRAVVEELRQAGALDAERQAAARGLTMSGGVVMALGVAGLVVFALVFGHLGDLPLIVPGSVMLSGLLFLIGGQAMGILSREGARIAAAWGARRRLMRSDPAAHPPEWWPVAVGFGLTRAMAKVHPRGPEWLAHLSDPSAAVSAIVMSTAMVGGSGGAGGGAGGAGGSSSAS